jgi:transposase-like protein
MARVARKSDGRRIFTDKFKREQINRVLRGEMTLGELGKKLGIARSLLHRWKRQMSLLPSIDGAARGHAAPATDLRPGQYIRELQLLVGKQTIELELLRAEMELLRTKLELVLAELNALKKVRRSSSNGART